MSPRARRWILAAGGVAVVVIVTLAAFVLLPSDPVPAPAADDRATARTSAPPAPAEQADAFLAAFAKGDATAAGALTDDPDTATRTFSAVWQALAPKSVTAARTAAGAGDVPFTLTWTFGPGRVWSYPSSLSMAGTRVHWTPALVHPKLTPERGLSMRGQTGQPAVLDRDGAAVLVWQPSGPTAADAALAPLLMPAMARVAREQASSGGWHVALVDAAGRELETLAGSATGDSRPLVSSLSIPVQQAAQAAVDAAGGPARLVAIRPSTGDILAVAQNAAAGTDPAALNGLYPPGSTFKIATAAAALGTGAATPDTVLPCPGSITIGTRTIPNDNGFALGDVPLHTAFARSCNTTFGRLAADLGPNALSDAATQLGINADFVVPGITTEAGRVDPASSTTQRMENGIGQGTVQVSPFGMALMSATVAGGRAVTPRLWRDLDTSVTAGYQAPGRAVLDRLRAMMREVVTAGTATAIAGRGPVFGKTGTAQYGDGSGAHGWFTGYRGDLAFAVLLEGAGSSAPAVAAAGRFLGGVR